jgi:hypothetical protein
VDSRIREGIVDRGIERGEWEMRNLGKQLGHEESDQEPHAGTVGEHNSGQMSAGASDQTGTTPVARSNDKGSPQHEISKDDIRNRKVDPEAVRESFKEAELDPTTEREPEEDETAA